MYIFTEDKTKTYRQVIEGYYSEWLNGSYVYPNTTKEYKYPTPKLLAEKIVDYFVDMHEQNKIPNYNNLNLYLGFKSNKGLRNYTKHSSEFNNIFEFTLMLMEETILQSIPVFRRAMLIFKRDFWKYYNNPRYVINSYEPKTTENVDKNKL